MIPRSDRQNSGAERKAAQIQKSNADTVSLTPDVINCTWH